ncbi:MAG: TolC family protein, partial [Planctomycetes bacterium]|nr:TolC family protein [Planctomycetota bacterium]
FQLAAPGWTGPVRLMAVYWAAAVVLWLAGNVSERTARWAAFAIPLLDLPMVVSVMVQNAGMLEAAGRPDVAAAERGIAAATARIGVATADFFPRFDLAGSLGLRSDGLDNFGDATSRFWSIGPGFRWPVLDWGRIRNNVRVQDARTEQALISYERTVLTSFEDVESALASYTSELARAEALSRAVDASRRAVALAEQQYSSGLRDFLNVLTTQRAQFEAEDQLVASRQLVATNLVALYKALGGGWDVNFAAEVSPKPLQP